jgi:hypothetical protein
MSPVMNPPIVTPEQILMYGKQQQRPLRLEANVVAYIGYMVSVHPLNAVRSKSGRKGPSNTASAQNPS